MASKPGIIRPFINSAPISEFGTTMAEGLDETGTVDLLEVPGFSDLRRQRDLQLAEYHAGTRRGQDVMTLPVNCRWVGMTRGAKGEASSVKLMRAANQGYLPVTKDMVKKESWLTDLPPGSRVEPDGTIVNAAGDLKLYYTPAPVAARNQARKDRVTREQMDGVGTKNLGDGTEGFVAVANRIPGLRDVEAKRTTA